MHPHYHSFPCPNCGNKALRRYLITQQINYPNQLVTITECPVCDYLMSICLLDGKVIETSSSRFSVSSKNTIQ